MKNINFFAYIEKLLNFFLNFSNYIFNKFINIFKAILQISLMFHLSFNLQAKINKFEIMKIIFLKSQNYLY